MRFESGDTIARIPVVTLSFWVIKIIATTPWRDRRRCRFE